jgi:hypothetical protein
LTLAARMGDIVKLIVHCSCPEMSERRTSLDRSELGDMLFQGEEPGSPTGVVATPELLQ